MRKKKVKVWDILEWNVWLHSVNAHKIMPWNIFHSGKFIKCLMQICEKYKKDPELDLAEEVRKALMYCFWAKSEYEVVIKQWVGAPVEIKVDIYQQVMLNYSIFFAYIKSMLFKEKTDDTENR